jgi:hypothetical protein
MNGGGIVPGSFVAAAFWALIGEIPHLQCSSGLSLMRRTCELAVSDGDGLARLLP